MFSSARIKLTAWYLLIAMLISVSFSLVIYKVSGMELERFDRLQRFRIERRLRDNEFPFPPPFEGRSITLPPFMDPELVAETRRRLLFTLLLINGGILVFSGVMGYFLAGRTLRPIKEMVEEQDRFVTDASHELRTPLTALKSTLEVNRRDKKLTLGQAKAVLTEGIGDVNKLQVLSESLLRFGQIQETKMVLKSVSVSAVVREAVAKIEPLAKEKEVEIKTRVKEMGAWGNKESMVELLVILLDNAVKYSRKGSVVWVSVARVDNKVAITIKDSGIGIAAKDLPHIFDRFYRADTARSNGGYGLGLSIAKNIVQTHRGTIAVESKLGKGSVFAVKLPVFSLF